MQMDSVLYEVRSESLAVRHKAEEKHLEWKLCPSVRQTVCDFTSTPQTSETFISDLTLQTFCNL